MQEELRADAIHVDGQKAVLDTIQERSGPPEATLKRRAQSYSDFHDAVKSVLGKDRGAKENEEGKVKFHRESEAGIETELDFANWYHGLEHDLLDSSSDDYT